MSWIFYAAVAAVSLAAADVFVKIAAGKVPNSLGTLIYGTVAFGVGLTWFVIDRARGVVERSSRPLGSSTRWGWVLRSALSLWRCMAHSAPVRRSRSLHRWSACPALSLRVSVACLSGTSR